MSLQFLTCLKERGPDVVNNPEEEAVDTRVVFYDSESIHVLGTCENNPRVCKRVWRKDGLKIVRCQRSIGDIYRRACRVQGD